MILNRGLKMHTLVFFCSWKNIILGPGDVNSGPGSVRNSTTLDKSQLYQPLSSCLTVEVMMPGSSPWMLYSGMCQQVCAFISWSTLGEQLLCTRLSVGGGTWKVWYLEEFRAEELQSWLKSVSLHEPTGLGKEWKQIFQFKWWFSNSRQYTNHTRGNNSWHYLGHSETGPFFSSILKHMHISMGLSTYNCYHLKYFVLHLFWIL